MTKSIMTKGIGGWFKRLSVIGVLSAMITAGFVAGTGEAVLANADECGNSTLVYTCIKVRGFGLFVEWVESTVGLKTGTASWQGHWEFWGSGWHYNTPDKIWIDKNEASSGAIPVNRNFPNNSKVCAGNWTRIGPNSWKAWPTACATIHN